jgi:phosphate transport system substrate-binding protein
MRKPTKLSAMALAFALVLAACGGDDATEETTAPDTETTAAAAEETTTTAAAGEETTTTAAAEEPMDDLSPLGLPIIDPFDVSDGSIGIAGSSTVFPLATAVMSKWEDEGGPNYPIDSIGSGGGLERFCVEGASDIANASRAIEQEEIDACASIDRTILPVRIGSDALSLVISTGNYFAQELTLEEIATIYSLANQGATWADVNPDFPAHPIGIFTPGTDSGTFDYFNEIVFEEADPSPIVSSIAQNVGEDDNVTVQGVAGDGCTEGDLTTTCAIGYFGFAFFQENSDTLQAVAVDGVVPSAETVADSSYPISRPLFMYTANEVVAEKPQVAEFLAYVLNNVNEVIGDVGYFPAPEADLQEAADNIAAVAFN